MKKIGRRGFLIGLGGATVALPFLPSLAPRVARAAEDRPRFAAFVRAGNGIAQEWEAGSEPERFWPRTPGPLTEAVLRDENGDRAVSELARFAPRLNIVRGIDRPFSTPSCGHAESIPQCLTGARVTEGDGNNPQALGQSADWRIAQQLHPGKDPHTVMAGPGSAYIAEALSWRGPSDRNPAERSPATAYMRFMGLERMPPEVQQRIIARQNSVNDLVREQLDTLRNDRRLGSLDRRRLNTHFEAIRDMELNLLSCELDPGLVTDIMSVSDPEGNDVRPQVVRHHMSLIAFAFSCDAVRAATLQIGEGNDQTQYEIDGVRQQRFHWISHRIESDGSDGTAIPNADLIHHRIDRLQLQMFGHLLDQLMAYESPYGGPLLDDCAACWINDLGNGPPHGGRRVPWLIAGNAAGCLRTGQYVDVDAQPVNKMLNTVLTAVGCTSGDGAPVEDFGDPGLEGGRIDALVGA